VHRFIAIIFACLSLLSLGCGNHQQQDDIAVMPAEIREAAAFSAAVCVVIMAAAPLFARLMGAEDQEIIRYSARSLRMALPFVH
jgi:hypothetical protein